MTDGTETIVPKSLTRLADDLRGQVAPLLQQAHEAFNAAVIAGSAFSTVGLSMQVVYPGTRQWALHDCQRKSEDLDEVCQRLVATAKTWEHAEQHSTIPDTDYV